MPLEWRDAMGIGHAVIDADHRHLIEIGLMSQLPDLEADFDDSDDQPIDIQGEPLSETVIRERR